MAISCNKYNDNRQLEKKKEVVEQIKNVYLIILWMILSVHLCREDIIQ